MIVALAAALGVILLFVVPFSALLNLVFLAATIFVVLRFFGRAIGGGHGGAGTAFIAAVIVLPVRVTWALLKALGRMWAHSHARRVHLRGDGTGDRLARAMQRAAARRAARTASHHARRYASVDDADRQPGPVPPEYPKDEFEELWQQHLRSLDDGDDFDRSADLLVNVVLIRHAGSCDELPY